MQNISIHTYVPDYLQRIRIVLPNPYRESHHTHLHDLCFLEKINHVFSYYLGIHIYIYTDIHIYR
jgi:hypothetical protein